MWEALQEPASEPSDDDELDTEDGEVNTPGLSSGTTQGARDGRTEATRDFPLSAPPAFASTSTNAVVGDNSRSQMKRKEYESLFPSKKRTRYVSTAHSDQDDIMDSDLDEYTKYRMGKNSKPAPEQKPMGGRQTGASLSISSTTMNRKSGNDTASPIHPRLKLMRKTSGMKPPPPPKRRLSNSAMAESIRPATRDPPSKLAGLPLDAYKRGESKTVPASDPGRSVVSAPPVDKKLVDKTKAPLKRRRVLPEPQTTRKLSTSKSKAPSEADIIVISDSDDSPPPSISQAKSKSKSIKPSFSAPAQGSRTSRNASFSASSSAKKGFLPKAHEVIEIFDSDDEQLPSKARLPEKDVGGSSSGRLQESTTGSSLHRDQSRYISPLGGKDSDGGADVMNVDGGDLFNIPLSPQALSEEFQMTGDTNDNQGIPPFIPLPSSSPSSVGLSPKDNYLSTPPAPTTPITPLSISSPRQQSFTLPTRLNSTKKPITPGPSIGTSTGSPSNRLGFSSATISFSSQAPPPADKHRRQFARKMATQSMPEDEESSSSSESEGTTNIKANKGKEKEMREPSSSSSGTESISMSGLRDALAMEADKLKQRLVSPFLPKKQVQTLAEAITSAGQLNRIKKMRPRLERNTKDGPVDPTSSDETGVKDGPTADEHEKAIKAAIVSSRILADVLKQRSSVSAAAAAAKVTESPVSSPLGERLPLSPTRTQDFHAKLVPPESPSAKVERFSYPLSSPSPHRNIMAHDVPSEKPLLSLETKVDPESSVGQLFFGPAIQPKTEPSAAFEFKSGTAVIVPHKTADLEVIQTSTSPLSILPPASSSVVPTSSNDAAVQEKSFHALGLPSNSILPPASSSVVPTSSNDAAVQDKSFHTLGLPSDSIPPASSSVSPTSSNDVDVQDKSFHTLGLPSDSILPPASSSVAPTSSNDVAVQDKSFHTLGLPSDTTLPPASSSVVPTSSNDAAVQDEFFHTLGLSSDDSSDDEEEECQGLLQSSNMDVIPSHDVQSSLQGSIVVRHKPPIGLDTSVEVSSPLKSFSATTEVSNENSSVSPPIPEVPTRRSSRLSSNRSSRSASSEGFGIAFDFDSGPPNSIPVSRASTPEVQEPPALPSSVKTYGGFRALTWKDFRKDLNNFTPKTYYAKNLPHSLQDHINSMSEYTQMMQGMRDLFKATILENTVEDEPDAPPIDIWNRVDNQSTPPWEFYYTNNMWLGEGVPPPDIKNLLSCTCKGGCNPKSKTCACLLRQREAVGDPQLEFAYDKNGRLKIPGYPIFECNDLCGCSDECRNRVVQQGRKYPVSIGKTETKGWGVFSGSKKIPEGTFIGIYSGELLTDAEAQERGIKYNKFGRTYLFDIDFHHLKDGSPTWENSFTVDAYHAGNFTRFLNHSCDPNCRLYACYINEGNIEKPLLAVFTRKDIEPHTEICFNYQGNYDDVDGDDDEEEDDDIKNLDSDHVKDMIYVPCRCGAENCTGTMFK